MSRNAKTITSETPLLDRVHSYTTEDLVWKFDDSPPMVKFRGSYWGSETVDPAPCYAPDRGLVVQLAGDCEATLPLAYPPSYHLLSHEAVGRTNGFARWDDEY